MSDPASERESAGAGAEHQSVDGVGKDPMRIIEIVDTGTGLGIDKLVLESDHGGCVIEIMYSSQGFEISGRGNRRLLVRPLRADAFELRQEGL